MPEAGHPDDLLHHREHGWALIQGDNATFGITWFAPGSLQEVVCFDPPTLGAAVTVDHVYAEIESAKAVSELYAPSRARSSRSTTSSEMHRRRSMQTRTDRVIRTGLAGEGAAVGSNRSPFADERRGVRGDPGVVNPASLNPAGE